jgi:LacI family transcriptional regulator
VSDQIRERVLLAISLLNYKPNGIARSLKNAKTNIIGLILPDMEEIYSMQVMKSIERMTSLKGYKIIFCSNHHDPKREVTALQWLIEKRVDGIIMFPTGRNLEDVEIPSSIPVVLLERKVKGPNFDLVRHEHKNTAIQLVQNIYKKKGQCHLLFIHGSSANQIEEERLEGALQAIDLYDQVNNKQYFLELNSRSEIDQITEMIYQSILKNNPDVIFATNPNFLAGAIRAALKLGLRISEDIEITGFGEIDPFDIFRPLITVAKEQPDEIGQIAVNVLFKKINKQFQATPQEYIIKPKIIVGNSNGKLVL